MRRKVLLFLLFISSAFTDNWNGEDYHKHSSSQKEAASNLLRRVHLQGNENILDVGCGDGKISARLAGEVPAGFVMGVDTSLSMISFAKKNFSEENYPNLTFLLMDAERLDEERTFDCVFSFTALQWVSDHNRFLEGAYQVLVMGGKLAVSFPLGLPEELQVAVNDVSSREEWNHFFKGFKTGFNFSSKKEFEGLLIANHFVPQSVEVVDQHDVFSSKEEFQSFISQWFPYLRPIPSHLKEQFIGEVLDRFIELNPLDTNQRVHFNVKRLEVVAVRNGGY